MVVGGLFVVVLIVQPFWRFPGSHGQDVVCNSIADTLSALDGWQTHRVCLEETSVGRHKCQLMSALRTGAEENVCKKQRGTQVGATEPDCGLDR